MYTHSKQWGTILLCIKPQTATILPKVHAKNTAYEVNIMQKVPCTVLAVDGVFFPYSTN